MPFARAQLGGSSTFMMKPAGATLNARTCLRSSCWSPLEGKSTYYCHVLNNLLNKYGTDDIIAEADADITSYKQP